MEGLVTTMSENEQRNSDVGGLINHFWKEIESGQTPKIHKRNTDEGKGILGRIEKGDYRVIDGELNQLHLNGYENKSDNQWLCAVPVKSTDETFYNGYTEYFKNAWSKLESANSECDFCQNDWNMKTGKLPPHNIDNIISSQFKYNDLRGLVYKLTFNSNKIGKTKATYEILAFVPIEFTGEDIPKNAKANEIAESELKSENGDSLEKWKEATKPILKAIEAKREELKLGGATRILAPETGKNPDKKLLEEGSISCGPARWQFWGASVYFYLDGKKGMKDNIPIICAPGRFYVYNTEKNAVLIRLSPTQRDVHLTVPSAWREYGGVDESRLYPASNTCINNPNTLGLHGFFTDHKKQPWLIADCDTYRERTLLSGLTSVQLVNR